MIGADHCIRVLAVEINPGGRLPIKDVVGRDAEILRYWKILRRQGLILSAERRIGKTHIVLKMRDECPDDYLVFYQDLESVHSLLELARALYSAVSDSLSAAGRARAKVADWSRLVPTRLAGLELPDAKDHWKAILDQAIRDVVAVADSRTVLLIWDEFPLMLYNLQKREGTADPIELLDHLRKLRQLHSNQLRFLFTGSVGLHLIIRALQRAGNANDPVNDMYAETVPPMALAHAEGLCIGLLAQIDISPGEVALCSKHIVNLVGGFPYYIHHVVDQLDQLGRRVSVADVDHAVEQLIYGDRDPANLRYYVTRIGAYYDDNERTSALAVLDVVSAADGPLTADEIMNLVNHGSDAFSQETVRSVLRLLVEDHYLLTAKRDRKLKFSFRWRLVKQWWKEARL